MNDMRVHHIGLVVKSIEKSRNIYMKLGYISIADIVFDEIQSNRVLFMKSPDCSQTIELIDAVDESSSVYNFKEGYHHICYEIDSGSTFMEDFKKLNIGKIFKPPLPAPAINNRSVRFAYLNNGMFIEFLTEETP